jgi:hypothetical protein
LNFYFVSSCAPLWCAVVLASGADKKCKLKFHLLFTSLGGIWHCKPFDFNYLLMFNAKVFRTNAAHHGVIPRISSSSYPFHTLSGVGTTCFSSCCDKDFYDRPPA